MNSSIEKSRVIMHRYVFLFLVVLAFGAGVLVGNRTPQSARADQVTSTPAGTVVQNKNSVGATLSSSVDFQEFWDVWQTIQQKSVKRPVDEVQLYHGALSGLVASLGDPYSMYFEPDTAKQFQEQLQGSFSGIGAEVGAKDGEVVVVAPLPGSPAELAGLKAGDAILEINATSTLGISVDEAVKLIRGQKGTKVQLVVGRDGVKNPLTMEITRDQIVVKSVVADELQPGIVRITITSFDDQTQKLFDDAVAFAQQKKAKGIVLDLRNDPGGFFDGAIQVASEFLNEKDVVVAERGAGATTRQEFTTLGQHRLKGIPLVVLINGGSASAAEIVAGALQDHKVATLIGQQSFGKGSVQEYEQLPDGGALKLTVALWYTPDDHSINSTGITPDVVVNPPKPTGKPGDIANDPLLLRQNWKNDVMITKALQILNHK